MVCFSVKRRLFAGLCFNGLNIGSNSKFKTFWSSRILKKMYLEHFVCNLRLFQNFSFWESNLRFMSSILYTFQGFQNIRAYFFEVLNSKWVIL
jgi:hypothetical protein